VRFYQRGDASPACANTYGLVTELGTPYRINYVFDGKPHEYLPDYVGTLCDGGLLIAEAGREPVELLVNNAGIAVVKPFTEITSIEWEQTVGVNVTAPFLLTQRFAPRMPPGSSVVNILSVAARTAFPNWSAYCMSKFALEGFSRCVREELRDRKVRVINVYPAATDTEIWSQVEGKWPRDRMMSATQVADAVAFALARPTDTLIENITLSSLVGNL